MKNRFVNLKEIVDKNFQLDEENLLHELHKQFPEKLTMIRELAANSSDAGATLFSVLGIEKDGFITLIVSDNGDGIKNLRDYFTVFKSLKEGFPDLIGTFGVGKISMLAVNPVKFELLTSTGNECWHAVTGSLIKRETIEISEVKPVLPKGTTIELTYKLERPFKAEMEKIKSILENSVAFLPMDMVVHVPVEQNNEVKLYPSFINQAWPGNAVYFHRSYTEIIKNETYEITLGIGKTKHELYQNKVFITDKYKLLEFNSDISVHGLSIMINSNGFELPMGRHAIINTEVLEILATKIFPHLQIFYRQLYNLYKRGNLPVSNYDFDVLTSDLVYHFNSSDMPWNKIPIFKGVEQNIYSYSDLERVVASRKTIYVADANLMGVDFSDFNKSGIVLSNEQHGRCSELIKEQFVDSVIDLNSKDLVMEEPLVNSSEINLNKNEKKFQDHLGFSKKFRIPGKRKKQFGSKFNLDRESRFSEPVKFASNMNFEEANLELECLNWRVSKLVQRDGKTRSTSHLFLFQKGTIILNLYHPKIAQLVALTDINASLSAHFAMALAIDTQSILPHIDGEQRQNLLMIDALSRISEGSWNDMDDFGRDTNLFNDFYDNID